MDTDKHVVMVHGFISTNAMNYPIRWWLEDDGFTVYDVPISGLNTQDMRKSSQELADRIENIERQHGHESVNLLGISMGGLIGLHYIRCRFGHEYVDRLVALGSPFQGTQIVPFPDTLETITGPAARQMTPGSDFLKELHEADSPADTDVVSIIANGDLVVPEESARLEEAKNIVTPHGVWPVGHYTLMVHPRNYEIYRSELIE